MVQSQPGYIALKTLISAGADTGSGTVDGFVPLVLGTQEHWNAVCERELQTFQECGDMGEIWQNLVWDSDHGTHNGPRTSTKLSSASCWRRCGFSSSSVTLFW
uniref:Uncharacterized protein n=1 Tax=Castor canadensis TaxID=51338 RepID=A0A8C0X9X3_CASCN